MQISQEGRKNTRISIIRTLAQEPSTLEACVLAAYLSKLRLSSQLKKRKEPHFHATSTWAAAHFARSVSGAPLPEFWLHGSFYEWGVLL